MRYKMLTWKPKGKKKQTSILIRILKSPVTAILKVSHIYMNSMSSCSQKLDQNAVASFNFMSYGPQVVVATGRDPARSRDELNELILAVSKKPKVGEIGSKNDGRAEQQRAGPVMVRPAGLGVEKRSYSVGVGRIGRIDENAACEFHANVNAGEFSGNYYYNTKKNLRLI